MRRIVEEHRASGKEALTLPGLTTENHPPPHGWTPSPSDATKKCGVTGAITTSTAGYVWIDLTRKFDRLAVANGGMLEA